VAGLMVSGKFSFFFLNYPGFFLQAGYGFFDSLVKVMLRYKFSPGPDRQKRGLVYNVGKVCARKTGRNSGDNLKVNSGIQPYRL